MESRRLVLGATAASLLLWSCAFVLIRATSSALSPGPLACLRLLAASITLSVVWLRRRRPLPRGRPLSYVVAYGVLWFAGYTLVLNAAEHHLDAATAALLVQVAPILVAVVAGLTFGDGFPRPLVLGLIIAFLGVVLITAGQRGNRVVDAVGITLGLAAAVLYAAGMLLQKLALGTVDPLTATWLGCVCGLVATLPFASQAVDEVAHASLATVGGVLVLGVGCTAIAFTTWAYALARSNAGSLAATTLCVPVVAGVLSWVALGELPTMLGVVGGLMCLGGVGLSRRKQSEPTTPQEQAIVIPEVHT